MAFEHGRLGGEPELKHYSTAGGRTFSVCTFSIAATVPGPGKHKGVSWLRCKAVGAEAEPVYERLKNGKGKEFTLTESQYIEEQYKDRKTGEERVSRYFKVSEVVVGHYDPQRVIDLAEGRAKAMEINFRDAKAVIAKLKSELEIEREKNKELRQTLQARDKDRTRSVLEQAFDVTSVEDGVQSVSLEERQALSSIPDPDRRRQIEEVLLGRGSEHVDGGLAEMERLHSLAPEYG